MMELEKQLESLTPINTNSRLFQKTSIPEKIGVYTWSTKSGTIVYAGSAVGVKSSHTGLYRRIITELLNPNYLLVTKEKTPKSDAYQVRHCTYTKQSKKPAIDKNAFRKNVGRLEKIAPGEPTVNYIKSNFLLKFIEAGSEAQAKELEKKIIAEKQPKYNIQGK